MPHEEMGGVAVSDRLSGPRARLSLCGARAWPYLTRGTRPHHRREAFAMTDAEAVAALRQAAEAVRAQIPSGGLTVASVERLLRAADAACAAAEVTAARAPETAVAAPSRAANGHSSKRREARERWAEIARRNAAETGAASASDGPPAAG
jgi:hypothetical protein